MDQTRDDGFIRDVPLNEFFSRPIRILERNWAVDSDEFVRFNPWQMFWENPRNLEKIRNFYLLKCTMHIKLLINGNAFYYGRGILGYEPLHTRDNSSAAYQKRPNAYVNQDIIRLSQRMHFYFNPTESQGGSLKLPFFWDKNAMSIPDRDWRRVGQCVMMSINDLKHANGGTEPISLTVLAWAEDVAYSIPTSAVPEMMNVPEMADEYNDGVVSRPASAIARFARSLSNVPVIGAYARATEIGAGAVAAVAKIFGFSKPTELDSNLMVPNARHSLATVDGKMVTNKLSVDSKQEITIDPTTTGVGPWDELPIASIAGRESYFQTFDWNVADGPGDSLYQIRVDPFLWRSLATAQGTEYHLPACAAAVLPFRYWRGTLRFRFQIVSSAYHKGRIRIVYDPVAGSLDPEYNTHYTTIHDIANEKDFTVDIGWAQNEPYRRCLDQTSLCSTTSRVAPLSLVADRANGVLSVHVVNALTVPGTVEANIKVNVFVSALDDFEVAMPSDFLTSWRIRQSVPEMMNIPEMADEAMKDMDCCDDPVNDPPTIDTMADAIIDHPNITKLFYGEAIGSFRQMMKRECLSEVILVPERTETSYFAFERGMIPENGGIYTGVAAPNGVPLVFSNGDLVVPAATNFLNYTMMMFAGWRGSVRWTVNTSNLIRSSGADQFNSISCTYSRVARTLRTTTSRNINPGLTNNMICDLIDEDDKETVLGAYLGNSQVNPVQSIEVPFYSNKRFYPCAEFPSFNTFTEYPGWRFSTILPATQADSDLSVLYTYCSAGEDFNLFFYQGLPALYYQPLLPNDPGV